MARNFRTRFGEIDIVARDGDTLVFVEVRLRSSASFGLAQDTVGGLKRRRLIKAAMIYLGRSGWRGPARFDVVAFNGADCEHVKDAFDA